MPTTDTERMCEELNLRGKKNYLKLHNMLNMLKGHVEMCKIGPVKAT